MNWKITPLVTIAHGEGKIECHSNCYHVSFKNN